MKKYVIAILTVEALFLSVASIAEQKGDSKTTKSPTATTQTAPTPSTATPASAIAICGIKPPPPVGFWPDEAVCLCDGKKCKWVWMKK